MHEHGAGRQASWPEAPGPAAQESLDPIKYRARDPAKSPLYRLIDKHYDTVKAHGGVP